jgi:cytochrome oxidase Cu insertion factor (SCO1/SenC/PrrC family)
MALSVHTENIPPDRLPEGVRGSTGGGAERLILGALGLVVVIVIVAGVWSIRDNTGARTPEGLPILGSLPDFSLVERSGRPLTRADLAGQVWVANFIFTSCQGVCPLLSSRMAKLRQGFADSDPPVLSVSVSVDPTRDSPEVLRGYAERYKADPHDWLFVTGGSDEIRRLISEGFLLSVAERSPEEAGDGELITHSDRFVLVDEDSQIRGYYRGFDDDVLVRLKGDIGRLTRGG